MKRDVVAALMSSLLALMTMSCAVSVPSALPAPEQQTAGTQVERITIQSASLRKTMRVDVYLPPAFSSQKKYPVLYVFHGKDGNADTWMDEVKVRTTATRLIRDGKIQPLIIVSPEIDNSYGVNSALSTQSAGGYSRGMYEDFVVKDLIPYIDGHYPTKADRNGRFIGGLSMGGFVALHDAFLHPDLFSKVGVMSAALWVGGPPAELNWIYPTEADKEQRDPITLAEHGKVHDVSVCIIEGAADPFFYADRYLYKTLHAHQVDVTYQQFPGSHDYPFWSGHAAELLTYLDAGPNS